MVKCKGKTKEGKRCKLHASKGNTHCKNHIPDEVIHSRIIPDEVIPSRISRVKIPKERCSGKTQLGNVCKKFSKPGEIFCYLHLKTRFVQKKISTKQKSVQKKISTKEIVYNSECPICLEEDENLFITKPCDHRIHLECVKGMMNSLCPMCRVKITNFPKRIADTLKNNEEKKRREDVEAEHTRILATLGRIPAAESFLSNLRTLPLSEQGNRLALMVQTLYDMQNGR